MCNIKLYKYSKYAQQSKDDYTTAASVDLLNTTKLFTEKAYPYKETLARKKLSRFNIAHACQI